jgi:alpha-L-arabinofuranosidase
MVLTDGPQMLLTPTYDVFWMYRPFQDSTALAVKVTTPEYKSGSIEMPAVDAIAARGKDGLIHLALVNLDPHHSAHVRTAFAGTSPRRADGWILTATGMDSHNTFDHPNTVRRKSFHVRWGEGDALLELPAKSVVVVTLRS